jgi:hypothetical protein
MNSSTSEGQVRTALQSLQAEGLFTRFTLIEGGHGKWTHELSVYIDKAYSHAEDRRVRVIIGEALQGFPAIIKILMTDGAAR